MALNPIRDSLSRTAAAAQHLSSPFRAEAETALADFRALRANLERQVGRGDITPKVARQQAADAARNLKNALVSRTDGYSPVARTFLDRLILASEARKVGRVSQSSEALQRETNRLLRLTLIEQQLATRAAEFEGRTSVRPLTGGQAAPTLDSLLAFHQQSELAGDDAAREWARRQLEGMRSRLIDPADLQRIDTACDRPEHVNPRVVTRYCDVLREADTDVLETFVAQALESRDAGACCAAFVLARAVPEGSTVRWVRAVLEGLKDFPDAALEHLRSWEAEARDEDARAARAHADQAAVVAETEARLSGLEAPDSAELYRRSQVIARPMASPGEPIGLTLDRRGYSPDEFAALRDETTLAAGDHDQPAGDRPES